MGISYIGPLLVHRTVDGIRKRKLYLKKDNDG